MSKNQTVLITGASTGIGLEFAKIFYSKGYNLILVSRDRQKLQKIKESFAAKGDQTVNIIPCDLSQDKSAQNLYNQCKADELIPDILVNNAGFGMHGEHVDLSVSEVENMINLNILSLTSLCGLFGRDMKERKSGFILNVASTGAYQPTPYHGAYAATKSYVLNFSEALAKELEDYGVTVTCLSPGATDTDFFIRSGIGDVMTGFFAKKRRMDAKKVAELGVSALFSKKLSTIAGLTNKILAWSNRFAPRPMVAGLSKLLMKNP
jgi:short-subunit dehydrogenase